jgi:hypothetical protein
MADMKNRQIGVSARLAVAVVSVLTAAHSLAQQPNTGQISGHVVDVAVQPSKGQASSFAELSLPKKM